GLQNYTGEYYFDNESGKKFVYGLPVFSRRETNLMYGIANDYTTFQNNYLAFSDLETLDGDARMAKAGEYNANAYPATHLLTEITSSDFVDIDDNGPTVNDFGSYTTFEYD